MDDFKSSALTTKRFVIAVDAFIYKMLLLLQAWNFTGRWPAHKAGVP